MVNFYKFLFYKLYRISWAERETVYPNISFVMYASLFELFHIILIPFVKFPFSKELFLLAFIIIGLTGNYFLFIKNDYILKLNEHFQNRKIPKKKENLIFFGYIFFLFAIMIFETYLYENGFKI